VGGFSSTWFVKKNALISGDVTCITDELMLLSYLGHHLLIIVLSVYVDNYPVVLSVSLCKLWMIGMNRMMGKTSLKVE
jgi:hypothetical protein